MVKRNERRDEPLNVRWSFEASDPAAATAARASFLAFLRTQAPEGADIGGCAIIFGELVSNAIKHTPGGTIGVELDLAEPGCLRVRDRGRGFALVPKLPTNDMEGGRGLFLVSRIAHDVRVAREPEGCTVTAVLPLSDPQPA